MSRQEQFIELVEQTANMLRGICMDPRIPQDTKEVLWSRVRQLDSATEDAAAAPPEMAKEMAELLRSACAIAERQGAGTAWERFAASIRALGLNSITARTYRVLPSDAPGDQQEEGR